jgi:hypothetical protein
MILRWGAALLLSLGLCGCIDMRVGFQRTPPAEAFATLEPGRTTRVEVLRALGPPDEVVHPAPGEALRRLDARRLAVLSDERIFEHPAWTWAREERSERTIGLLPAGPYLFRHHKSRSTQRRWRVEFDERGRVSSVAVVDELEP